MKRMDRPRVIASDMPHLRSVLEAHPGIDLVPGTPRGIIDFSQGEWQRTVQVGATGGLRGLVELMDNNPMVCADTMSVPDPASTLALIAVGPLIRAGLLVEAPTLLYSFEPDADLIDSYLETEGWTEGATVAIGNPELGEVLALRAICMVPTPEPPEETGEMAFTEFDELYEEAYSRSFFVRQDDTSEWDTKLVAGQPFAIFRLSITPATPNSLLTIQVMADRNGKCGAAQLVHAMNVMAGFEESLGCAG